MLPNAWLACWAVFNSGSKELILIACCSLCEYPPPMFLTIPPTPKKSNVNLSDPPKFTARFWCNLASSTVLKFVLLWCWSNVTPLPLNPPKLLSCPRPNMEELALAREFINPWRWFPLSICDLRLSPPLSLPKLTPKLANTFCFSDLELAKPLNIEELLLLLVVDPIWAAFWSNAVADICEVMFSGGKELL